MNTEKIRNFSIIAHIDHGKITLADRILELTGAVSKRESKDQMLDNMDLERERGITIKLNAVKLNYKGYILNLIDTPGHVDFTYEVSRSLAACEGAILVVDAAQGIEAQSLANYYLALENDLTIIPVINKIDLPNADIEKRKEELKNIFGFEEDEIVLTSGKTGVGVDILLDKIIQNIPSPKSDINKPFKSLIFDSVFDSYKGVVIQTRVFDGKVKIGDKIKFKATNATYEVTYIGVNTPKEEKLNQLDAGEVGFICASIKHISDVKIGDTIVLDGDDSSLPLEGYKEIKPMVYSGIYPVDTNKYNDLKDALEKLKLNDASLKYEPETSKALGFGFRCGFLGLLHMDIIKERIEREFNIDIILTSPSAPYKITKTNNEVIQIDNPGLFLDRQFIKKVEEPYIKTNIFSPSEYVGPIMDLCQNKRGTFIDMNYIDKTRVNIHYEIPLSEIVYDFFDKLKSYTIGYASFDYEFIGYKESDLVRLDILLNGEIVDAFSIITHKSSAYNKGKNMVEKLKEIIPNQLFEVPIQAVINGKVIARTNIKANRKNVLAKCYGGDISRKRKLLEKQKEGKKKMKMIGNVELPKEAFLSILSVEE